MVPPHEPAGPLTIGVLGEWLLACARGILNPDLDPHVDLFIQGFNSLRAVLLLQALQTSPDQRISQAAANITVKVIYENPTIMLLSARIVNGTDAADFTEHIRAINAMIQKYSAGLAGPENGVLPNSQFIEPAVVLLTGSTGGLGSFLLSELLQRDDVQRVFAFNRPCGGLTHQRQTTAFLDRGLSIDLLSPNSNKLVCVEADASLPGCGLPPDRYEEIRNSVTLIIHNAWRVDFNLAISSFEDSIRASRNLIDLGLASPQKERIRFLFTSSIGSAQAWNDDNTPFPEEVQPNPSIAFGAGYGESKYVTERIIVKSGLHATSLRIGQIAGAHWATSDWFPILVISSITLGVLPGATGVVSWLREKEVASAIVETAFAEAAPPPALNIINPHSVSWAEIIDAVKRAIEEQGHGDLQIVPFQDWFQRLEDSGELDGIPARKLLEFFRTLADTHNPPDGGTGEVAGMTNFSTAKAQEVSATMANMQAIGGAEADAWVTYWHARGAF